MAAKFLTDKLFGGDPSKLSPQERETVLALSQAVGALAGGLSGQDLAGIALNAGIAKNSVENNWLSRQEIALMESERAACGGEGGDVQACKDSVTRAYDELNAERDRELLAHGAAVELSMRSYPATSEADWKREFAARIDVYWQQQYQGIPVQDRVAGATPGADAAYAFREIQRQMLAGSMQALVSISDKGPGAWFMDKMAKDAEALRDGMLGQFNAASGLITSKYPSIEIQSMLDQASVMTKVEETQAYLALVARSGNQLAGILRVKGGSLSKVADGGTSGGKPFIPRDSVKVSAAHSVDTIGPKTWFGDGSANTPKSVVKGGYDIAKDVNDLNSGKGVLLPNGDVMVPSGRIWGTHPDRASMFPKEGPGIVQLSRAEFRVYTDMVRDGGLRGGSEKALEGMISAGNAGVNATSRARLLELYNSRGSNK
ncbi:hypothetical protein D3C71_1014890 [compost metagenome]